MIVPRCFISPYFASSLRVVVVIVKVKLAIQVLAPAVLFCFVTACSTPNKPTNNNAQQGDAAESKAQARSPYAAVTVVIEPEVLSLIATKWNNQFRHVEYPVQSLDNVVTVEPGSSIQAAIDAASSAGGGVVLLKAGTHVLTEKITLKNRITLCGEGREQTLLKQAPSFTTGTAIGSGKERLTDILIKNLTLDGLQTGGTNGIVLTGTDPRSDWNARVMLQNVKVTNWAGMGVHIKRTASIVMDNCEFQHNGAANGLFHNIYFLHVERVLQSDCDMSFPVLGKGNKYTSTRELIAQRCSIRNCRGNGIQADHVNCDHLLFHKYSISGCGRVAVWFPCEDFTDKHTYTEDPAYAPQFVIFNRCSIVDNQWGGMWRSVRNVHIINSTFRNAKLDLGLLKCDVSFENSTLDKPAQNYTDVKQWPQDVKILW